MMIGFIEVTNRVALWGFLPNSSLVSNDTSTIARATTSPFLTFVSRYGMTARRLGTRNQPRTALVRCRPTNRTQTIHGSEFNGNSSRFLVQMTYFQPNA